MELDYWGNPKHPIKEKDSPKVSHPEQRARDLIVPIPFMRTSATVRRQSPQRPESNNELSMPSSTNFIGLLSTGCSPSTNEPWSSVKLGSHLSNDPSSAVDRQLGLLTGNAVTRNPGGPSSQGDHRVMKRARSDLPAPSRLRKRSKKSDSAKKRRTSSRIAWNISEHIAQLKHKCLDFNWGNPVMEIKNKHKPTEAVATVRRRSLAVAGTQQPSSSGAPAPLHSPSPPPSGTLSGLDEGAATRESLGWISWEAPGVDDQELGTDEIPSYLLPPNKPRCQQQSEFAQIPDGRSLDDGNNSSFLQSFLDDATTTTRTTSGLGPSRGSQWSKYMRQEDGDEEEGRKSGHYGPNISRMPPNALDVFKSKFIEE